LPCRYDNKRVRVRVRVKVRDMFRVKARVRVRVRASVKVRFRVKVRVGKCLKHTQSNEKNILKKQLSLQLFLMANFDRVEGPIDMRVWKGRLFENILKFEIVLAFRNTNLLRYVSGIISGLLFILNYNLSICLVHVLF
jgi:hypothetical protein